MVKGKGTSRPYVSFIGNSATDVTGSMHLVRFQKYVMLLDCGMIQLNDPLTSYKANVEQLKKIKPTEIDYILLSHLHIDHSGLIPALFARGCHAHIYVPKGSILFLKLLWLDSMKIMQSDCTKITKHSIKASPFYDENDVEKALMRCIEIDYFQYCTINENIKFMYYPAGHIIHAAQIHISLIEGNIIKRIGYTGDIGGTALRPYTAQRYKLPFCDLLIGENTYNTPTRPNKYKDRDNDLLKIQTVCNEANKILIPCFALGRTQELLTILYKLNIDIPVYLDSPLAQKICDIWNSEEESQIWEKVINWDKLHIVNEWEQSLVLQNSNEHCIILSASGFLGGGRVLAHLKTILPNNNNHILFVGYAGENNLASQIKNGDKQVVVDGEIINNKANITELRSFSSHASYEELIAYYKILRFNKIALVHGEQKDKVEFANTLQNQLISQGNSARVICTNAGQKIYL